jgi:hypothetical protein
VRRLDVSPLRWLQALILRSLGRPDPRDTAAYEEAARKAFLAGTLPDAPNAGPPAGSMTTPAERPLGTMAARPEPQLGAGTASSGGAAPDDGAETLDPGEVREDDQTDPLAGREAPNVDGPWPDLLRTRSAVTPMADDFFDGLIRRVERDR